MSRTVPAALLTALGQSEIQPYLAVEMLLDSGPLRLWTGFGDKTVAGNTYTGGGTLLSIDGLGEVSDLSAKSITITLSGMPAEIIAAVRAGIDMFDCVLPSRNGRNAYAFTDTGPVRLRNNIHIDKTEPIQADCDCYCCQNFSRGALRHFFNVGEMLGPILTTVHNLRFYQRLMTQIRSAIERNEFEKWASQRMATINETAGTEI